MEKQILFDALWDLVKDTDPPVDFTEIFVRDEEADEVCVMFHNIKASQFL